ncbi:tyrosine-type recombinase/integrase [Hansschlegelia beijingensis]|uniref:Integrase n=1 Tax=Hansschlegelia beijingensis TaxID=1133344 RepID=A0A7W6D5F5_9HYPH|nr:site-specific integrase [Hansschlegelia beijingensis]MBB3972524.1 integrase [Hansschlegelia beijingensis]
MPKKARELSALDVKRLAHGGGRLPTVHAVGGVSGLAVQVTPNGAKSWLLRIRAGGRRREIGLGGYPDVTLAAAREKAREVRDKIAAGVDPILEKRAARASLAAAHARGLTFADAVERYLEKRLAEFRNEKHRKQWRATIDVYATPLIGGMLVSDIALQDMLRVLEPIWTVKTETASRLRGRVESILNWATVAGHRVGDNPARWKGNLEAVLPKPGKVAKVDNQPALALDDAATWFAELRHRDGMATRALEFLALCASRSGEVRGAVWSEIDLKKRLWIIPAARMKMRAEHRVPLSDAAAELLETLPRIDGSDYVFAAVRGGPLSDMSLSAVMRRMQEAEVAAGRPGYLDPRSGRPAVPHGLRSTFRDWAAERTEYPRDMAEIALAHSVGSEVERAYRRSDMVEKRRAMMDAWSRFLSGAAGAKVVRLGRRG